MSRPIFPIIREQAPIVDFFRQKAGIRTGQLTESQKQMAEEFRIGMSQALGVPPEAIREDLVTRWIVNWTKAFVKPEYWAEVAPTTNRIRDLGITMGEILRSALSARERLDLMKQAQPPLAEQPQRTKEEPYYSNFSILQP
ncbi:MAG TPA: hypothetical protein VMW50_05235 [Dehalococcoidia bacterium]|uniref:Uncharacterized protein n=1 Tax=viral metagenome TaxID=1070528 RepID=A0A6M3M4C9_9ZZZZ|nr:hypothetical protein [Dehalococcoidia bacterium]